ncbi:flavodoxin family protein [Butyricicoccus sp. Marseille-Q5471]|uniref:flavodoxin family protein n=1 Tax=Butyricicoccus sp. Marseille-Q5471 TaxID=3039493 RepID=UPI0024BC8D97|nr:flavodoxin family protein [Butyricicoccus sp. Marseille-Q5471]
MSKKVVVLSTSIRPNSNSDILADEFARGAKDSGNEVEKVSLVGKELNFCRGCLACQKTGKCIIQDDAIEIAEKVKNADVVVFATPVYYYAMSGQMKTLIDRMNCLFSADYKFREAYLIASAADTDKPALDGTIKEVEGWVACFPKVKLKDIIYGVGLEASGEAKNKSKLLKQTYNMGKTV